MQYRVGTSQVVVKFKVGLESVCKNLVGTMKTVGADLKRMLFKKFTKESAEISVEKSDEKSAERSTEKSPENPPQTKYVQQIKIQK